MNRRMAFLALTGVLVGTVAQAQHTMVADFDRALKGNKTPLAGGTFLFSPVNMNTSNQTQNVGLWNSPANPTGSGSPVVPANISRVAGAGNATTGPVPAGDRTNAYEARFSFRGVVAALPSPNPENRAVNPLDTFLRMFYAGSAAVPNGVFCPLVNITKTLKFDIWSKESLRVAVLIGEGAATASVPLAEIGANGWLSGPLESLGGLGDNALQTTNRAQGGFAIQAGVWQTIEIPLNDPLLFTIRSYVGLGDGILTSNVVYPNFVSLNSFLFSPPKKVLATDPEPGSLIVAHEVYIDNIRQGEDPAKVLAGRVKLEDWTGPVPPELELKVLDANNQPVGATVTGITLTPDGEFYKFSAPIVVPSDGKWKIAVKAPRTISSAQDAFFILGAGSGFEVTLRAGDIDGDDSVTVFDYDALSSAFDTGPGDANWNPLADLDGDDTVSVFDYDILSRNFDLSGDAGSW